MKDEIKEILEHAKSKGYIDLDYEESELLLDYITNLQQIEQDHQKLNGELREELEDYKSRIDKSNEFIKENTRWFDSEYAKIYGELCDCEGAKDNRLEVLVNPSNLSKILGGDKDVKD